MPEPHAVNALNISGADDTHSSMKTVDTEACDENVKNTSSVCCRLCVVTQCSNTVHNSTSSQCSVSFGNLHESSFTVCVCVCINTRQEKQGSKRNNYRILQDDLRNEEQ